MESIASESEAQLTDQGMCLGSQVVGRGAVLKDWTLNLWNLMLPSVDCLVLCGGIPSLYHHSGIGSRNHMSWFRREPQEFLRKDCRISQMSLYHKN